MNTGTNTRSVAILAVAASLAMAVGCGSSTPEPEDARAAANDGTGSQETGVSPASSGGENTSCDVSAVYFAYDSSELDTQARSSLENNARCLQARAGDASIVGMTDPRGTEEYNLALGDRRARTVTQYMTNMGVEQNRLNVRSVGEEFAQGQDESTWAGDRRAEVRLENSN